MGIAGLHTTPAPPPPCHFGITFFFKMIPELHFNVYVTNFDTSYARKYH